MLNTNWVADGEGATVDELRIKMGWIKTGDEEGGIKTNLAIVRDCPSFGEYDTARAMLALKEATARATFGTR